MSVEPLIIAIDGPSGVGKSSVARGVASRLGVPYLETGAMYRALGLKVLETEVDPDDADAVESVATGMDLRATRDSHGALSILLDGRPIGPEIRRVEVGETTSRIAVHPGVRRRMVALQREWAELYGAVVEGRDIGTRVFPETPYKFFLTAPDAIRIKRRESQLRQQGVEFGPGEVEAEFRVRDLRDSERSESPLRWDETYTVLDTADLDEGQVVERIVEAVRRTRRSDS